MAPSQNNLPFVLNVSNSIIGVTLLAIPFCFKTCGILLGALILFFATWLTLRSCQLLMKAGITSRRRSYSLLAQYTHGASGKLIVELGMIGLQFGTIVAQLVIIGDLGPPTVSKVLGIPATDNLRTGTIMCVCVFVALPLALLKDLRKLSKASMMCILFYMFFTMFIVLQSIPNLWKGDWLGKVTFWNTNGFFRCLPIFSFAFGCQTQLFIVYDALLEPSLKRINSIVGSAVHMCTVVYLLVGFFGYIAFCEEENLSGDIITHLTDSTLVDGIKFCFASSIAVSLPLIVFPCRASLYTLLFPQKHKDDVPGHGKIPEFHFMAITVGILTACMITTILVPNIEVVLALTGATTGCLICYIFPALFFLSVMAEGAEKLSGRVVLTFGLIIMIASTYTTVMTPAESHDSHVAPLVERHAQDLVDVPAATKLPVNMDSLILKNKAGDDRLADDENRHEPPIPQEPDDVEVKKNSAVNNIKDTDRSEKGQLKVDEKKHPDKVVDKVAKVKDAVQVESAAKDAGSEDKAAGKVKLKIDDKENVEEVEKGEDAEEAEEKVKEAERKQEVILQKLEQQQEEQQKLIEEQKQILEELKQHQEKHKDTNQESLMLEDVKQNNQVGQEEGGAKLPVGEQMADQPNVLPLQPQGQQNQVQVQRNQQLADKQQFVGNQQGQGNQQLADKQQFVGNQQGQGNQQLADKQQFVGNQQGQGNQLAGNQQGQGNQLAGNQQGQGNQLAGNQQGQGNQLAGNQQGQGNQLPGNQQADQNQPVHGDQVQVNQQAGVGFGQVGDGNQVNPGQLGEGNLGAGQLAGEILDAGQLPKNNQPAVANQQADGNLPVNGNILGNPPMAVQVQDQVKPEPANQQVNLKPQKSQQFENQQNRKLPQNMDHQVNVDVNRNIIDKELKQVLQDSVQKAAAPVKMGKVNVNNVDMLEDKHREGINVGR